MKVLNKKTNQIEEVNASYALNYLIPRGLAVRASEDVLRRKQKEDAKHEADAAQKQAHERALAARLSGTVIVIKAKANDQGELFGSITKAQIKKEIKEKVIVELKEPIKEVGEYPVRLKVGSNKTQVIVRVVSSS